MKRLLFILNSSLFILHSVLAQTYTNPVNDWDFPDPSVQRAQDGTFYSYATNCQTLKSTDLVHWTAVNNVFSRPTWNDTTYVKDGKQHTDYYSLWASDVNYVDGRYVMYYASALWGNGSRTGIGVATGITPYKFVDRGRLFRSTEIKVENSIDPVYIEEGDKKYLAWGSFNGIYITELSDDGLKVRDMNKIKKIAGTAFEGAMIHKHGNHYYLFASIGSCCEGLRSTYQTVVGRSTNLMGPYISKGGQLMTNNGYTVIITKNNKWVGPGHNSEIVTDDEGQDWLLYHAYDAADPDKGRVLLLDRLRWDAQGWPYIYGGVPSSTEQGAPIFYKGDGARMTYKVQNADFMKSGMAGWTIEPTGDVVVESGLGTPFLPLMHAAGGNFTVSQSGTGFPDGCYEVQIQGFSTQGNARICVGSVVTPLLDGRTEEQLPATSEDLSKKMLQGSYTQVAYGLVVGGKLTLSIMGDLAGDEELWLGNLQLTRRDKNETALAAIQPWYVQRVAEVLANPNVDDYYKGKLEQYINELNNAVLPSDRYAALVSIHKMLDRVQALQPIYDSVSSTFSPRSAEFPWFDLSGRRILLSSDSFRSSTFPKGVYVQNGRKVVVPRR